MKTIALIPDFEVDLGGRLVPFTARALIKQVLDAPPSDGFTPSVMRERARIDAVLDGLPEDATELELEDADAKTLLKCVQSMRFGFRHKGLLDFCDAIEEGAK